jgi:hypothetical protein
MKFLHIFFAFILLAVWSPSAMAQPPTGETCRQRGGSFRVDGYWYYCYCGSGKYGPIDSLAWQDTGYNDTAPEPFTTCTACPTRGSYGAIGSNPFNNAGDVFSTDITDCYTSKPEHSAAAHGYLNARCFWSGSASTGSYSDCTPSGGLAGCDPGYYATSTSASACVPVGYNRYTPYGQCGPTDRKTCPDPGMSEYGDYYREYPQTDTDTSDSVNDCFIDCSREQFGDEKGWFHLNGKGFWQGPEPTQSCT